MNGAMIENNRYWIIQADGHNHPRLNLFHQIFDAIRFRKITFFDDYIAFDSVIQTTSFSRPQQSRQIACFRQGKLCSRLAGY